MIWIHPAISQTWNDMSSFCSSSLWHRLLATVAWPKRYTVYTCTALFGDHGDHYTQVWGQATENLSDHSFFGLAGPPLFDLSVQFHLFFVCGAPSIYIYIYIFPFKEWINLFLSRFDINQACWACLTADWVCIIWITSVGVVFCKNRKANCGQHQEQNAVHGSPQACSKALSLWPCTSARRDFPRVWKEFQGRKPTSLGTTTWYEEAWMSQTCWSTHVGQLIPDLKITCSWPTSDTPCRINTRAIPITILDSSNLFVTRNYPIHQPKANGYPLVIKHGNGKFPIL